MKNNFTNTWWGKKWLDSFLDNDKNDAFKKGKYFAKNENFLNISIKPLRVSAKVKGRKNNPYFLAINFKKNPDNIKKIIIKTIITNHSHVSGLLNKKLPVKLLEELNKKNINLFPQNLKDINFGCSCTDLNYPCKHISALLYLLADQIDKNPLIIFLFHDIDIFKELKNNNIKTDSNTLQAYFSIKKIITESNTIPEQNNSLFKDFNNELYEIDYSVIPDIKEELLNILSNKPVFYKNGNFKNILLNSYKNIGQKINKLIDGNNIIKNFHSKKIFDYTLDDYKKFDCFLIDESYNFKLLFVKNYNTGLSCRSSIFSLMNIFDTSNEMDIKKCSNKLFICYRIFRFCLKLLQNGAYIPQILSIKNNEFKIRWIPAIINENVRIIFNKLLEILPGDTVKIITEKNTKQKQAYYYPGKDEQLRIITSIFLSILINVLNSNFYDKENFIDKIFFTNAVLSCNNNFEYEELPASINLWLSRFYIMHKNYVPVIKIDSDGKNYSISILIENKNTQNFSHPLTLKSFFENFNFDDLKTTEVLKDLNLLADYLPEINNIIKSKGEKIIKLNSVEFTNLFFNIIPSIKLLGIKILMPAELHKLIKPKISITITKNQGLPSFLNYMTLNEVLNFQWKVALGDKQIDKYEFLTMVSGLSGIVKIRDQFVYINEKEIDEIIRHIDSKPELKVDELLQIGLQQEFSGTKINITNNAKKIYDSFRDTKFIPLPENLNAVLRNYQERGYNWIYKNIKMGLGCLIADDMGLGKTLQVIAVIQKLKEENIIGLKKCLIILPTSLVTNWYKEINKFTSNLRTCVYHGSFRCYNPDDYDILLTTYGIVRNELQFFQNHKWYLTIIDEAQSIKNPNSIQAKCCKKINSEIKIALSGTPLENRLFEVWSIFDFINKGYLGKFSHFKKEYALPIEVFKDQKKLEKFRKITAPFILRRVKTDKNIIRDLPEKIQINKFCSMTPEQTALYQNLVHKSLCKIDESEGTARRGLILKLMISLKQICNHPAHYLKNKNINPMLSGKTTLLINLLENIIKNNEKVLIFTQYTEMGKILYEMINKNFKISMDFLHGGISRQARDIMIENFQHNNLDALILTLKAGGTGLNLTNANYVIHFDLWWNPAIENQATDRAYRIGQTKNVMVYRLLTQGTLEEKINQMLIEKKELANLTISNGEVSVTELSNDKLYEFVNLF